MVTQVTVNFWAHIRDTAQLVCRAEGNYGEPFGAERNITQGGLLSSLMFNECIDAIVREWLHQMLGEKLCTMGSGTIMWLRF